MDKAIRMLDVSETVSLYDPTLKQVCEQHGILLSEKQTFPSLTGYLVRCVLPFLTSKHFERVMKTFGAVHWKEADDTILTRDDAKHLLLLVLQHPKLEPLMMTYFTFYEFDKRHFPEHIFDLGLGHKLRLLTFEHTTRVLYFRQKCYNEIVVMNPALPELSHANHYYFNNSSFIDMTYTATKKPVLDLTTQPYETVFFVKMILATSAADFERWNECWAHALSALDIVTPMTPNFHDLLCLLAKAAGMSSLCNNIVFRVLKLARLKVDSAVDHMWQRLLVLHRLAIFWGYFQLEKEIFDFGAKIIPKKTEIYNNLVRFHLKSLIHQIEDLLVFQFARQRYHNQCNKADLDTQCFKAPLFEASFFAVEKLLNEIEVWLRELPWPGEKEYYMGLHHIFTTFYTSSGETSARRALGMRYITIAHTLIKISDLRYLDTKVLSEAANNVVTLEDFVVDTFVPRTLSRYSPECAESLYRAMVYCLYTQKLPENRFKDMATSVRNYYKRSTHDMGYRDTLLLSLVKVSEGTFRHDPLNQPDLDYPNLTLCIKRDEAEDRDARSAFVKEKNFFLLRTQKDVKSMVSVLNPAKRKKLPDIPEEDPLEDTDVMNSQLLLSMDTLGEQVYAFGYFVTGELILQI